MGVKKKKKMSLGQLIGMVTFTLLGAVCGILMVVSIEKFGRDQRSFGERMGLLVLLLICMYVAMMLQIVIHEAGHLLFGLLTGYRFSSFRIGSFMWTYENGKLQHKRLTIAGTGGQCLMDPPDLKDGELPYVLYNLGGSLLNMISAVLFLMLYLSYRHISVFSIVFLMLFNIGVVYAAMNGIPMRMGNVDNDGYNALALGKDKDALKSFWIQMRISSEQIRGKRLKDMSEKWFEIPTDKQMENSMIAARGVLICNRLMDQHRFDEASLLIDKFLSMKTGIVGIHRNLLVCDRIFCRIISGSSTEEILQMMTVQQKKFMKSMKKYPTVLRTEYVYVLLVEKNPEKAKEIRKQFQQIAKTYPYPSDIECEMELLGIADRLCNKS